MLFDYLVKKQFLAELAYSQFLAKQQLEIATDDFSRFLDEYAEKYGWERESLEDFIREIERVGVINIHAQVSFRHRSFLDYFGAFFLYEHRDEFENVEDFVVEKYFNDSWGDVPFYYVGLKRRITREMLERIFAFENAEVTADLNKLLAGRLLQAGWHSPSDTKYDGIKGALAFVPRIREKFLSLTEEYRQHIPKLFADAFLLSMGESSFRSAFLIKELRKVFNELLERGRIDDLRPLILLLSAMRSLLSEGELRDRCKDTLDFVSGNSEVGPEDEATALIFLGMIEKNDTVLSKAIHRRLKGLAKKYPGTMEALMPKQPKSLRSGKSKGSVKSFV